MSEENPSRPEKDLGVDDLSEYLRAKDPSKAELAGIWRAAIGLQKVDGLTPSAYLVETARRNIEGEITVAEAGNIIGEYYKSRKVRAEAAKTRTDEADIVSQRIAAILAEPTFSFSPASYVAVHRKLFIGIYKHAGKIRDYNITKSEWVLKKDTVRYESADVIAATYFRNALVRANYTNIPAGVHPTLVYLERFFRNLLLGEDNVLKSRFLRVGLQEESSSLVPPEREQVGGQVGEQVATTLPKGVARLLKVFKGDMSVLGMMVALKLGGRRNFLEKYLSPAIELGLVEMTQPDSPRSPTQKYRLTAKGLAAKGGAR